MSPQIQAHAHFIRRIEILPMSTQAILASLVVDLTDLNSPTVSGEAGEHPLPVESNSVLSALQLAHERGVIFDLLVDGECYSFRYAM